VSDAITRGGEINEPLTTTQRFAGLGPGTKNTGRCYCNYYELPRILGERSEEWGGGVVTKR